MSDETRILAGVLLLALVTVETGGLYLVKLWRSSEGVTEFQIGFARAGHAHAGVLLVLVAHGAAVRRHGRPLGCVELDRALRRTGRRDPDARRVLRLLDGPGRTRPNGADRPGLRRRGRARPRAGQPRDRAAHGLTRTAQ